MAACAVYDFTLKAENITKDDILSWLEKNAKTWCFQLEKGETTGYVHFQGRVSLRKKVRLTGQIKVQPWENHCNWSVTSNTNSGNCFYVLKDDTRIEGPWTEKDVQVYIPRQIREIGALYPWQQSIVNVADVWDTRTINMIYDPKGNIGKSVLVGYMRCHGLARKLPPLNDYKDVMRIICDMPTSRCYLFDMPRAMKKDKLGQLYTAIEEIKSGYAFDDRYSFKEKFFDCPNIWIFANTLPDFDMLSGDRWKIWEVEEQKLQVYVPPDEESAIGHEVPSDGSSGSIPEE